MKKIVFKICLLCMIVAWLMAECNINPFKFISSNKKDDISRAISEAVGEEVYYMGRSKEVEDGVEYIEYVYVLCEVEDERLLAEMVNAVNEELEKQSKKGKLKHINLHVEEKMGCYGCYTGIAHFSNYKVSEGPFAHTKLVYADIHGSDVENRESDDSRYDDISMYTSIEGIKWLRIRAALAKQAKEKGIDWYEIWPELEYYEVD